MTKLTAKQRKFADEYIKTGNATQSAIKAGYSKNYAKAQSSKLLVNVGIKSYIDSKLNKLSKDSIMTAQEALKLLTDIAKGDLLETVVVPAEYGPEKVQKEPDIKTRIMAIKEILKRYPSEDAISEQQVRKLKAEADIVEYKAKSIIDPESLADKVVIIDDFTDGKSGD